MSEQQHMHPGAGPSDSGIHCTQLAVSASLLSHSQPPEQVIATVLEATRVAAGKLGENWNWRREERTIRGMCKSWLAKHPQTIQPDPETHTPPPETEDEIKDKAPRGGPAAQPEPPAEDPAAAPRAPRHARPIIRIIA